MDENAHELEFVWNDGGRAAGGYVGLAGDCVTRSIAIATGAAYRAVYDALGDAAQHSPRDGLDASVAADYLKNLGWQHFGNGHVPFEKENLPNGVVIVHLRSSDRNSEHFCAIIDHVIHDTWNPSEDDDFEIVQFWRMDRDVASTSPAVAPQRPANREQELTQREFEKILGRLRALDSTASNHASTEGEKRNALRMMQNLMLRHNLSRDDITVDENVDQMQFTRIACPVNSRRAYHWEKLLSEYLTEHIFSTVDSYQDRKGHRTFFWFYGPRTDVENCITLFRDLLLTIATAAQLRYGGYTRGSGASYAEGYVDGLPRQCDDETSDSEHDAAQTALVHNRVVAVKKASRDWLRYECGIELVSVGGQDRHQHDEYAARRGKRDGAKHELPSRSGKRQARITGPA